VSEWLATASPLLQQLQQQLGLQQCMQIRLIMHMLQASSLWLVAAMGTVVDAAVCGWRLAYSIVA
jgi:hypothetical protein